MFVQLVHQLLQVSERVPAELLWRLLLLSAQHCQTGLLGGRGQRRRFRLQRRLLRLRTERDWLVRLTYW